MFMLYKFLVMKILLDLMHLYIHVIQMILSTFSELYIAIIFKRTLKILSIVFINLHHASLDLIYT